MTTFPCRCGNPESTERPNGWRLVHGQRYPVTVHLCDGCARDADAEREWSRSQ